MLHQIARQVERRREPARARTTRSSSAAGPTGWRRRSRWPSAGAPCSCWRPPTRPAARSRTEELTLPGLPPRHVLRRLPRRRPPRRCSRAWQLERHGLRWVQPRALLRPPAAGRARRGARARRWTDGREPRRAPPGRRGALAGVRRPVRAALRRRARHDALRLPAGARAGCSWSPQLGPRRHRSSSCGCCSCPRRGSASELFERSGARAWLYGSAMHGDTPPRGAGQRDRGRVPQPRSATRSAGRAPRAAPARLAEALVGRLRELGGDVRTGARVVARAQPSGGRVTGVELEGGEGVDGARSWSPTSCPRALVRAGRRRAARRYAGRCAATATGRRRSRSTGR